MLYYFLFLTATAEHIAIAARETRPRSKVWTLPGFPESKGLSDGSSEGASEGSLDGDWDGSSEGEAEGSLDGETEGSPGAARVIEASFKPLTDQSPLFTPVLLAVV